MTGRLPNWAVMCGALRRPAEFKLSLLELLRLRDAGLLDGIVLSTWSGELDLYDSIRPFLQRAGVQFVESPGMVMPGVDHTFAQHAHLKEGLAICPADCNVLKYRSDKAYPLTRSYERLLRLGLPEAEEVYGIGKVLSHKIACLRFSTTLTFLFTDFSFLANSRDLHRMLNFDSGYDWFCKTHPMPADVRWFSMPFMKSSPLLEDYFRSVQMVDLSQAIMAHADNGLNDELPDALANVFACYFSFLLGHVTTVSEQSVGMSDRSALFGTNSGRIAGVETEPGYFWTLLTNSQLIIDFCSNRPRSFGSFGSFEKIRELVRSGAKDISKERLRPRDIEEINAYGNRFHPVSTERAHWKPVVTLAPSAELDEPAAEVALKIWQDLNLTQAQYLTCVAEVRRVAGDMGVPAALRIVGLERYRTHDQPLGLALLEASARLADLEGNLRLAEILLVDEHLMRRQEAKGFAEQGLAIARRSAPWYEGEALALLARTEEA